MTMNMTTFDSALKAYYTADKVQNVTLTDHPLLASVAKMTEFKGKNLPIPIIYGNTHARNRTFSSAQTAAGSKSASVEDFVLTRVKDYSVANIDGETMLASMGDKGAFVEAVETEMDSAWESIASSLSNALYRDGTGLLATSDGTGGSSNVITLTAVEAAHIVHFEVGMDIDLIDDPTGTANVLTASNNDITAVDRDAGTFTLGNLGTDINTDYSFTLASGDGVAMEGDATDTAGALDVNKVAGLEAWIPSSAPGSTAFFGVDRSVDTVRLGGVRYDGSSEPLEEALINAATRVAREGGRIDHYFVSYERYADIEKALGIKREYSEVRVTPEIGFPALLVHGPKGPIKVVADQDCQYNVAWGLDLKMWKLYSLGPAPQFLVHDGGNKVLRLATDDGVQARIGYYAQFATRAPGRSVRLTLPT